MNDQERIRDLARPHLVAACNGGPERAAAFRARLEDYPLVFTADLQTRFVHFESLWSQQIEITAPPQNTEILLVSALGEELATAAGFPGGYRSLTDVVPDRIWIAWKYVVPGQTSGMAYDGLVWLDDRFVWFPKPWRVTTKSPHPLYRE